MKFSYKDKLYLKKELWVIFALGIVSGLPFLLTLSTLSFWLAEAGISKTTIGLFMLVSLPYSLKFLWAPIVDQFPVPFLSRRFGRRRGWALAAQVGLIPSLLWLGHNDPSQSIGITAIASFLVSIFSATQDIVIDAYRIESLSEKDCGSGAAMESIGFRFGMLASGAGALYLAHALSWEAAYAFMAIGVALGMCVVLMVPEPQVSRVTAILTALHPPFSPAWWRTVFIGPWKILLGRTDLLYLLGFIFCFKVADTVLNAMSAPFLVDLGYTKVEYANITKVFGISLMVIGGMAGGYLINQLGVLQSSIMCVSLQAIACLMFVIQSLVGYHREILVITVGVESFCSGLIAAVFIACLSGFCRQPFTASHFTLLHSFGSLCRVITSAGAGWIADRLDWTFLFLLSAVAVLPAVGFIVRAFRLQDQGSLPFVQSRSLGE